MIRIQGLPSNNLCAVSTNNQLSIINPINITSSGNPNNAGNYLTQVNEFNNGINSAPSQQKQVQITNNYKERISVDNLIFNDKFNGTQLNVNKWTNTSGSITIANGYIQHIYVSNTPTNRTNIISSTTNFLLKPNTVLSCIINMYTNTNTPQNSVHGIMIGFISKLLYSSSSACFILNANKIYCYIAPNDIYSTGTGFIQQGFLSKPFDLPNLNSTNSYKIEVYTTFVNFYLNNSLLCKLDVPLEANISFLLQSTNVGVSYGFPFAGSITPNIYATTVRIYDVSVFERDVDYNRNFEDILGEANNLITNYASGENSNQTSNNNTTSFAFTSLTAFNDSTPIASTLGGVLCGTTTIYNTDCIICAFTRGTNGITNPVKTSFINSIYINYYYTTATTDTYTFCFSLAFGSTSVALSTTESESTKAYRFIPLAIDSVVSSSSGYNSGNQILRTFDTPIVVQPNEYVAITVKNIGANSSQTAIFFSVLFNGWCE